jgi:2-polyprenyl-3-methyl-5-hydroxy-6-metoxy-1,4-benzoquinol methylase
MRPSSAIQNTCEASEYLYQNVDPGCAHAYLASKILKMLSASKRLRVLDLGCGNGSLSHLVSQLGHDVVGIDQSGSGIKLAKQNFPNCDFIEGSIYDLPLTYLKASFDVVISIEVIEHLILPRELIRNAKKCLKRTGRLIISTPYHGYLKNLVLAVTGSMDRHFTSLWDGGHIKFFSVKSLETLLADEGFVEIEFDFAGRFPFLWKSMICSCLLPVSNQG